MNPRLMARLGASVVSLLALTSCGNTDQDEETTSGDIETVEAESGGEEAETAAEPAGEEAEPEASEEDAEGDLPDSPQAYSAITVVGDEEALPEGEAGEVSVVAISEPDGNTSFPFILQNRTDESISRVEVTGRALGHV